MDQTAKDEWLKSFQGATLTLEREFGSPKVNHMFERAFNFMGRNAFFISVRGRILLGEDQVSQAEQHIYDRIAEITKTFDRQIEAAKAVMLDAGIEIKAVYNKPIKQQAVIVSPMQTRYLNLLAKADELFQYINTIMLYGEITEREHSKRELQIKQQMRVVPSAIRKMTIGLRLRLQAQQAKDGAANAAALGEAGPELAENDHDDDSAITTVEATPAIVAPAEAPIAAAA